MTTIRAIEIPKWGMTMAEGTVDEWHLAEGDSFAEGDLLVAIESTKVMNDLVAGFDGVLRRIIAHNGDVLPVGALIGVSADPSVSDEEIDAYAETGQATQVAGGVMMDGLGAPFITRIVGDPHNVTGISLPLLRQIFLDLDVPWQSLWQGTKA